jgi:hypothetical protein
MVIDSIDHDSEISITQSVMDSLVIAQTTAASKIHEKMNKLEVGIKANMDTINKKLRNAPTEEEFQAQFADPKLATQVFQLANNTQADIKAHKRLTQVYLEHLNSLQMFKRQKTSHA